MGNEFRYPFTIEIWKLLWFIGLAVAVVLTFQHFELPYGNIISSLSSARKDLGAGNSNLLTHAASSTPEMVSNTTQSNGLNTTAISPDRAQEIDNSHGTDTPANVNNDVVPERSRGLNESSLIDSRGKESSPEQLVDTNTNSTSYVHNGVVSEGISGLNKSSGIDNHGKESKPEQLVDRNEDSTLEPVNSLGNGSAPQETERSLSREDVTSISENIVASDARIAPIASELLPVDSPPNITLQMNAEPSTIAHIVPVESNTSKVDKDAAPSLENDGKTGDQKKELTLLHNNPSVTSFPEVKKEPQTPSLEVVSISEMKNLQLQRWSSPNSRRPRWPSVVDQELLNAKSQIQNAPIVENDPVLYAPLYWNVSMFKKSYELMEDILKVYIYKEGERPIFHQPLLNGIYASEGWFMKLLEELKVQIIFLLLAMTGYTLLDSFRFTILHLNDFWDFWSIPTFGAIHSVLCLAPSETRQHMANCIRALCNSDAKEDFVFGKDASLPETYVLTPENPLRDLGGKPASKRSILAFFAGSMHGYLRTILLQHWENKDPDMKIFGRLPKVKGRGKMNYARYMKSSKYCICAKGYEVNSPRVVEAIFYECVPVIISDNFVPPFLEVLNWESFAVFVLEKDIPNLKKILLSIPAKKYRRMQTRVKRVQQHFLWHSRPVKYDVFHMILHSIWVLQIHALEYVSDLPLISDNSTVRIPFAQLFTIFVLQLDFWNFCGADRTYFGDPFVWIRSPLRFMDQGYQLLCLAKARRLLFLVGATVAIVIVVQYLEFPSSRVLVSLFSAVNTRSFMSRNSSTGSEALGNMTLSIDTGILHETTDSDEASDDKKETAEVSKSEEKEGSPNNSNESERKRGSSDSFGLVSNETTSDDLANQDKNSTLNTINGSEEEKATAPDASYINVDKDIAPISGRNGSSDADPGYPSSAPPMMNTFSNKTFSTDENSSPMIFESSNTSSMRKDTAGALKRDENSGLLPNNYSMSTSGSFSSKVTAAKRKTSKKPPSRVISIHQMNELLRQSHASSSSMRPLWPSGVDQEMLFAKSQIENAPLIKNETRLYAPIYRNVSMFRRSYELMEKMLRVYVYQDGEKPIFHQPILDGIYASEGWFMKHMEANENFVTKDPGKAHLFYLPFSSRLLELTLYAPAETRGPLLNCIRALCNADIEVGFSIGKDVSLPETYVRSVQNPLKNLEGNPPSRRPILAFFAGNMHGYVRPVLLDFWGNKDPDMKIFGPMPHVKGNANYIQHMKSSKFCICPRGHEVNSPRIVEAIFYECVPVIISDNFVPPFFEVLDWESFAVIVLEKDIPNLKNILVSISEEKYIEMHKRVKKVQQHFLWHSKPEKYDLFHMILHSVCIWLSEPKIYRLMQPYPAASVLYTSSDYTSVVISFHIHKTAVFSASARTVSASFHEFKLVTCKLEVWKSLSVLRGIDMATESKQSAVKMKPRSSNFDGSKGKIESSMKVKRIEISSKQKQPVVDSKNKSVSAVTIKTEVKSKSPSSSSRTTTTTTTTRVRQKKVFSLPGQRCDPPEEREPLRIFYESLSKQIPTSEMAEFWMMEHGLLSLERAKKAHERKQRKQKMQRLGTPIKSTTPSTSKPKSSQKQQQVSKNGDLKAKRKISIDSDDDDFILSHKRSKG
ncbi:hypothetical protein POTOM_024097 [Populus tomentosa]|uniref:Exostosin GT47 domain-containing protein n=1 Tax=Populus tomentosa TaxID=118781 RepID=A0A8X7ZMQ2_POPTO|nr:hypothetical protein POTOM_024097 [Populus tomentosa]